MPERQRETDMAIEREIPALKARQDALETDLSQLTANVDRLATSVAAGFRDISTKIDEKDRDARSELSKIVKDMQVHQDGMHQQNLTAMRSRQSNAVQWAGVAVILVSLVVGWAVTGMNTTVAHEGELRRLVDENAARLADERHAGLVAVTGSNRQAIGDLTTEVTKLQGEMTGLRHDSAQRYGALLDALNQDERWINFLFHKAEGYDIPAQLTTPHAPDHSSSFMEWQP